MHLQKPATKKVARAVLHASEHVLVPEVRVDERHLAARLGISANTVRVSLGALQAAGALTMTPPASGVRAVTVLRDAEYWQQLGGAQ